MIAHIVPQVYLKSWVNKTKKNAIYVYDKFKLEPELKNLDVLSNTNFQKKNEYILNIEDCCLEIYSDLFDELYNQLKNKYYMKYKNKEILSSYSFRNCCRWLTLENQADWIIVDLNTNNRYKYRSFRQELIEIWNANFQKKIENFFCDKYENNWLKFLSYLENFKFSGSEKMFLLEKNQRDFLIEFLGVQLTRKYGNFNMFKQIIEFYIKMIGMNTVLNDEIIRKLWLSNIYKYILHKETSDDKYKRNVVNYMIKHLNSNYISFEIYMSNSLDFLTSDNPIFRYESKDPAENDYIYFPINRKLCLGICSKSSDTEMIKFKKISAIEAKIINNLIVEHAEQHFVCYDMKYEEYII